MWFKKKSEQDARTETYQTIFDLVKEIEAVEKKAKNDKFANYLKKLKEDLQFSVNNNKKILRRYPKKVRAILEDIYDLLNHEIWNSKRIKKKLRHMDEIIKDIELL